MPMRLKPDPTSARSPSRSEEHTSELQSHVNLVCRLLLEKKNHKLPNYEITNVAVIPWDPGRSYAYNVGVGVSRVLGPSTFGVDAIYEPIRSYTWAEALVPTPALNGNTIAVGGKTIE